MASSADNSNEDETEVWYAIPSKEDDQEYYHNPVTGESTWVLPSSDDPLLKQSEDCDSSGSIRSEEVNNGEKDNEEESARNGSSDDDDLSMSSQAERQKKRMAVIFCILFSLLFVMFGSLSSSNNDNSPSDVLQKQKKHILSNNADEEGSYSSAADVTVDKEMEDIANDTQNELVETEQSANKASPNDGSMESITEAKDVKHKAPDVTAEMQTEAVSSDKYNQERKDSTQQADTSDTELENPPDEMLVGDQQQVFGEEGSDENQMDGSSHGYVNEQLDGSVNDDLVDAVNETCATDSVDACTTNSFDESSKIDTDSAGLEAEKDAAETTTNTETDEDKTSTAEAITTHEDQDEKDTFQAATNHEDKGVEPDLDKKVDDTSIKRLQEELQHTSPLPEDAAKNSNDEETISGDEAMHTLEAEGFDAGGVQDDLIILNVNDSDEPTADDNEPLEEGSQEATMETETSTAAIAANRVSTEVVESSDLMGESLRDQSTDLEEPASTVEGKNGPRALDQTMAEEARDNITESIEEQMNLLTDENQEMPGEAVTGNTIPESANDQTSHVPVEDTTGESGVVDDSIAASADDQTSTVDNKPASIEPIQLDWDTIRKATNIPSRPDDHSSTGTISYPVGVGEAMLMRLEIELDDVGYKIKQGTDSVSLVEKETLARPATRGREKDKWLNRVCRLPLGRKIIRKCQRFYPSMKAKAERS
ncbi:expressed unknown protein [Seminavis robusta]|uniref:WW domain-containing protein n=1 Tax=Seminavis robusta TaxID=568900 RepID=A0A9N8EIT3_9STRA|nr:expressed unknown protein [Seminavis robusta]|eukprot:Sro1064_g237280.1 n/a (709) ;mRNA; r:30486-32612